MDSKGRKFRLVLIILVIAIIAGIFLYNYFKSKYNNLSPKPALTAQQIKWQQIQTQFASLEELQKEIRYQPTSQQIQTQFATLEKLQKENNLQPSTQKQIQQQFQALAQLQNKNEALMPQRQEQ